MLEQDRARYAGQMPRVDSPFDASVFRPSEMIGLALSQVQPSFGLQHVMTLGPWIRRAKRESYAVEGLSLEPFCFGGCHLSSAWHRRIISPNDPLQDCGAVRVALSMGLRVGIPAPLVGAVMGQPANGKSRRSPHAKKCPGQLPRADQGKVLTNT